MSRHKSQAEISSRTTQKLRPRLSAILVCILILAYGVYFSIFTLTRHQALMTQSYDLGIYAQALWNTLQGDFLRVTIRPGNVTYLQHHFAPSMLLFVPLYAMYSDPVWLLILQSFIVSSGAWPIYRLAVGVSGREVVGVVFALVYLLFPALQAANLYDFHEITIAAPLLIWTWYFARSHRWLWFAVTGVIAVGFREEAIIFMLGMGFILVMHKSTRKYGLIALALSVVWLVILIMISFSELGFNTNASVYLSSGFGLGDTPSETLTIILKDPAILLRRMTRPEKVSYLVNLFAPVGYLSFFSWQTLILVAPSVVLNLFGEYPLLYSPAQAQYNALLAPFIVYTAVLGFVWLVDFLGRRTNFKPTFWVNILLVFVLMLSIGYHLRLAHLPYSPYFQWPQVTERHQLARKIAAGIPVDRSLSIQDNLAPHASHRHDLYVFPRLDGADYVYLDLEWIENLREAGIVDQTPQLEQLLNDPQYEVLIEEKDLLLLQRKE